MYEAKERQAIDGWEECLCVYGEQQQKQKKSLNEKEDRDQKGKNQLVL